MASDNVELRRLPRINESDAVLSAANPTDTNNNTSNTSDEYASNAYPSATASARPEFDQLANNELPTSHPAVVQPPSRPQVPQRKPVPQATVDNAHAESCGSASKNKSANGSGPRGTVWRYWWAEAIFLVFMFGSFAAIIAVIAPYQHRRLPSWPYSITINALIAIFTVILRGSILFITAKALSQQKWLWFGGRRACPLIDVSRFDNASRGPWGSLLLDGTLHGRSLLATLGGFIIVLTIAIDPFAHQVVRYYSCSLALTHASATIPRTGLFQEAGSTQIRVNAATLKPGLAAAINGGAFSPEAATRMTSSCPSGLHAAAWKESLLPLLYDGLEEGLVDTCDTAYLTPVNEL